MQDVPGAITTNNHVEAWHRVLKSEYIDGARPQRLDELEHILSERVVPCYVNCLVRDAFGHQQRRVDKAEQRRYERASAVTEEDAEVMLEEGLDGLHNFTVRRNFTRPKCSSYES